MSDMVSNQQSLIVKLFPKQFQTFIEVPRVIFSK